MKQGQLILIQTIIIKTSSLCLKAVRLGAFFISGLALQGCVLPFAYETGPALGSWQGGGWKEVCTKGVTSKPVFAIPIHNPENLGGTKWGAALACHGEIHADKVDISVSGSVLHPDRRVVLFGIPFHPDSNKGTELELGFRPHESGMTLSPYLVTLDGQPPTQVHTSAPIKPGEVIALRFEDAVTLTFESYADQGTSELRVDGLSLGGQ